jgi:hypothetical protein
MQMVGSFAGFERAIILKAPDERPIARRTPYLAPNPGLAWRFKQIVRRPQVVVSMGETRDTPASSPEMVPELPL